MRRQGSGVVVNIASMASLVALPVGSAYSASKAGLFAFGDALRRELRGSGIRVCQVLPVGVNTAGFFHQRTRGFRLSKRIAPLLQNPETVAKSVVRCLEKPGTRNVPLGLQGKAVFAVGAVAPRLVDLFGGFVTRFVEKGGRITSPMDNLFEPSSAGRDIRGAGRARTRTPPRTSTGGAVSKRAMPGTGRPFYFSTEAQGGKVNVGTEAGRSQRARARGCDDGKTAKGTLAVGISKGRPFAVSNVCRHQFAALGRGRVLSGWLADVPLASGTLRRSDRGDDLGAQGSGVWFQAVLPGCQGLRLPAALEAQTLPPLWRRMG
jgi:hypothetical protein